MKKQIFFTACLLIIAGSVLADNLHFSGMAFQGANANLEPKHGLVFWGMGSFGDATKNCLICPVNFPGSNALLQRLTIRYYDGDPDRAMRFRLMRMSIQTGIPEVQAEWNSTLLGDTGWTNVDALIYRAEIDSDTYSYWIEALLFGPGSFSGGNYLVAIQSVRINYAVLR